MPKKITKQIRRKLLAKHEEGSTFPELKREFSITDTRTLMRNLQVAEREREEREVRIRICTDSQQLHLDEIGKLAERCKESFKINFPSGDFDLSVEDDDLFESLKEHFPDATLWRNYEIWKELASKYKELWHKLASDGNRKAEQDTGLRGPVSFCEGLGDSFLPSALWYAMDLREKWTAATQRREPTPEEEEKFLPLSKELYDERKIQASCPFALEFVPERKDIAWGTAKSVSKCIVAHYKMIKAFWGDARITELADLRKRLRDLESQINRELRLSLLKRNYISHICDFCPVCAFAGEGF